jgi:two-component system phosphate regulon sensor histidine kinase PhoR
LLAVILAVATIRLQRERARIIAALRPEAGEAADAAVLRLVEAADAAQQIPALKRRFDRLIANCPLPVLLLDQDRTIVDLSYRAEGELDQPRKGRTLLETLESHELDGAAREAMDTNNPVDITVRLYAAGRRPFYAKLFPIRSDQKKECIVFLQDAASTIEFGELRSQFAATVSHELRTPLAGIRAMVETLQDPEIKPEDLHRFLERIDRETNRLGQLIDDILFLSSLESGATHAEGVADLGLVAQSVLEKLQPLATKLEVRINDDLPAGLKVNLPDRMVGTVLSNLIENAIKYSGRGSLVEIGASREGNRVKLVVRDDGIGIDSEHLPHIFERFYRVDKSRSRRLGGTGLGLSIVKHVVESAGGTVSAKSREGFGTEITVLLPQAS